MDINLIGTADNKEIVFPETLSTKLTVALEEIIADGIQINIAVGEDYYTMEIRKENDLFKMRVV